MSEDATAPSGFPGEDVDGFKDVVGSAEEVPPDRSKSVSGSRSTSLFAANSDSLCSSDMNMKVEGGSQLKL